MIDAVLKHSLEERSTSIHSLFRPVLWQEKEGITMPKLPRRRYGSPETNSVYHTWLAMVHSHNAVLLNNGENPSDYPDQPVAYETLNFGWILSAPVAGSRRVLVKF